MLEKWKNLEMQLDELKEKQELDEKISSYRQAFKKRLNGISISVSNILDYASKANVKLEFREKNPIAERLLIIYYSDMCNFEYYRNTIEIEGCKLGNDFMRAIWQKERLTRRKLVHGL